MWGLAGLFPVEVLALGLVHMQPPALYLWVSGIPPWPAFCSDFSSGQPWLPMIHCLPVQSWGAFLGSPPVYGFKDCRFYNLFSIYPRFGNWKSVHLLSVSNRYWLTPIYLVYILILCIFTMLIFVHFLHCLKLIITSFSHSILNFVCWLGEIL